ncbi:unnamed protein product [Dibothriocephalus latus]|uniref:Uncharacterized protein n=1 Tax=Dibothriocephalus latus TaxID=60516 RepID=A0A3P7PLK0_DIBLA|nr:unnamed protein product [Dibothriocephalus latus]
MLHTLQRSYFKDDTFVAATHTPESVLAASNKNFVLFDIKKSQQAVLKRHTTDRLVSVDAAPSANRFMSCTESGVVSLLDFKSKNCEVNCINRLALMP